MAPNLEKKMPTLGGVEGIAPAAKSDQLISAVDAAPLLQLDSLRKAIPAEAFEKNLMRSLFYMFLDYTMWGASVYAIHSLRNSSMWEGMATWQQWLATLVFWNVSGLIMWCIFVVGHDCGHGTFSNYPLLNDILGHVLHGSILVPFYPWQLSHRRHHMYHNHVDKDYSHPWYTPEKLAREDEEMARWMNSNPLIRFTFPIVGWIIYLYGMPDGSHFIPFSEQRMWRESPKKEYYKCLLSSAVVIAYAALIYTLCGSLSTMAYYYLAPAVVYGWWLVTVTYLQHHDPDTLVYGDDDWKFVPAAFETVDRQFGFGIDAFHHHITDGHVVHHLFFTKIPHYNLPMATKALRKYMDASGLGHLYKYDITWDFPYRVHKYFVDFGFASTLASTARAAGSTAAGKKDI